MAAVPQRDSRAGLIAAVVAFAILFVVALVFAIYYNTQMRRAQDDFATSKTRFEEMISSQALVSPEAKELKDLARDPENVFELTPQTKPWEALLRQRAALVRTITGGTGSATEAVKTVQQKLAAIAETTRKAGATLPSTRDNLLGSIAALGEALASRQATIASLEKELKDARTSAAAAIQQATAQLAAKDKMIADARAQSQREIAAAAADRSATQGQVGALQTRADASAKVAQEALARKDVELQAARDALQKMQNERDAARARLERMRLNVNEPVARQADGVITRIPGSGVVYINRGLGDQLVPGLTFEVYDKVDGIPPLAEGADSETLPAGKASIEVVQVGENSSECRIIQQRPGMALAQGDYIVNLVYDANTKYSFVVYGKFDLDGNQVTTSQDAQIIERLVTQWGGKVVVEVTPETDFVVLGAEPQLPSFSSEELQDPINKKKLDDAQAELNAYQDVLQQARDLHIPVLNQNRFLYLVGYYHLAQR